MIPRILVRPPRPHVGSVPPLLRRHYAKKQPKQTIVEPDHADPQLDPSFAALMNDVNMSVKKFKKEQKPYVSPEDITPAPASEQPPPTEGEEGDHEGPTRRAARRSPAAIFGTKNIGMIVLPEWLNEGVQRELDQVDNRRAVRDRYLDLLKPKVEKESRSETKNTEIHALARATTFLPPQYAAVANVLSELKTRVGNIKGPILEVTDGIAPGIWAAVEELGVDAVRRFTLVQRTRWGLQLAERLAQALALDVNLDEVNFKRDIAFAEMQQEPEVAMSTFMLSMLPTAQSRKDHLKQLLETDAKHIVIVDRGSTEVWEAMDAARTYLLEQSTDKRPLHITAPCPHQKTCPMSGSREACSFIQKLQRPRYLRRTKHAKRGEENVTYSYLIISRGERPTSKETTIGRIGLVEAEFEARRAAKADSRSELRPIEGGERGELEVVNTRALNIEPKSLESLEDPATLESVRAQAYDWPRLVAAPMKRSGHVVMDMCSPSGQLERRRYSKAAGRQVYYDARRAAWGDLVPHQPKSKIEVRTRGIMHLKKVLTEEEELKLERQEKAKKKAELEAAKLARNGNPALAAAAAASKPAAEALPEEGAKKGRQQAADDLPFESTGDAELDALYKELGIKPVVAESMTSERAIGEEEEEDMELERMFGSFEPPEVESEPLPTSRRARRQAEAEAMDQRYVRRGKYKRPRSEVEKREFSTLSGTRPMSTLSRPAVAQTGLGVQKRFMSARPAELKGRPKLTVGALRRQHAAGVPISVLTAYDYPTARLCASAEVDIILVGDSLAQVALGHTSTTDLTLSEMAHHVRAVRRGAGSSLILVDLPFGSFEASVEQGVRAAVELVKAGADAVKIEGGAETLPLVRRLTSFGIAVMPHIGLMPQRAASTGYRVQGKHAAAALELVQLAQAFEDAGAFSLLLEAIPHQLGDLITRKVAIPTIGIGAGNQTSGQVLVLTDLLGTYGFEPENKVPKFVREYAHSGAELQDAVRKYIADVRDRTFPRTGDETYTMPEKELEELRRLASKDE